ncbi:MAG: restriction endonuclease subunit S [Christensenellaceae bacterium]
MRKKREIDNTFVFFVLSAMFEYEKTKIPSHMQPSLRISDLNKYCFFLPNINQQEAISKKLIGKSGEIDRLIEIENQQIEKLKEYKQAVITEAVTKGLDKSAPMKDSGVDWIGKIPEGWSICRIKHIADPNIENSFIDGDWIESGDISSEGILYFTTGNVGDGKFKHQGNAYITEETFQKLNCKFAFGGDFVIARLNQPFGRSCIIPNDIEKCVLAVDIVILRPTKDFNKQYLSYITQCPNYQQSVGDKARGTAMKRISRSNLGDIFLIKPPKCIQNQIAEYLDKKCADIDSLIEIKQKKIDELNNYKKSLIYEYVTGKKEVV